MLRAALILIVICLQSGTLASGDARDKHRAFSDAEIARGLSEQLTFDDVLRLRKIEVRVEEGVALLSGTVTSLFERDRAVALAGTIRGVRAIVNQIEIDQPPRDEAALKADLRAALKSAPATEAEHISVAVQDGHVTLSGTADSHAEKLLATQAAKTVRGVRDVTNQIQVRVGDERPDRELRTEIKRRLQADIWVQDDLIRVAVDDGKVTLSGTVGSVSQKYLAEVDAFVAGVKSVDVRQLEVDSDAVQNSRRARKYIAPRRGETVEAVKAALRYDPRVDPERIDVAFHDGAIRLTGTVSTLSAKRAAEQDALRTRYVTRVDNQLIVRASTEDAEAAAVTAIEAALARDIYVFDDDITVEVSDGVARLTGSINTKTSKQRAAALVAEIPGIASVDNRLEVVGNTKRPTDLQIKYGIRNRLYWSSTVEDDGVTIVVKDGAAILTGEVDDRAAFDYATEAALDAGASKVNNRLLVREHSE